MIDKLEEELDNFRNVKYRMREEGFEYCFRKYSDFNEIDDIEFHNLRTKFIDSCNEIENYVNSKIDSLDQQINDLDF